MFKERKEKAKKTMGKKQKVEKKQADIEKQERDVGKVKASREKAVKEGEAAEKDMKEGGGQEGHGEGKFKKREEVAELEKVLVKIRTQVEIMNWLVVDEEGKAKGLETELKKSNYSMHHMPASKINTTPPEIMAGTKLYNVVVENEKVAKELLQNGKLKKHVTIIPLNEINAFKLSAQKLSSATKLVPGKKTKLVIFSPLVGGVRSVTLDGDVYDPSGTLSGGSALSESGALVKVQELLEAERKVGDAKRRVDELEMTEAKGKEGCDQWKLSRELEIKEHKMRLLAEQLDGSNAARIGAEIQTLKQTIADFKAAV
ncbi:hypothetical protein PILCRDRAFT_15124 [Piloderma croceum F 1598]|uniref:SMC hinge domain-containing protein n=1 Tax=Piloderma croceum (strain F 1598) TaxID=765440 RepID=A0A0C3B8J6_PILCF|nr:hypothetical protein PILCRDRAFT_15124 [Piloderma croceum F 1598]